MVDDDPFLCSMFTELLAEHGYKAHVFHSSEELLAGLNGHSYPLAFIDVNLPKMDGLDLAARLKEHGCVRDLVFMSGSGTIDHLVRAIKIGAQDYLKKPFGANELALLLNRHKQRMELREQLESMELKHYRLVQNTPLLIFTLDKDLMVRAVNRALASILGHTPGEAVRKPGWFLRRFHPDDMKAVRRALARALEFGEHFSLECRLLNKKGQPVHGILRSIPAHDANQPDRLEVLFVDITERVLLERAMVQNERLKTLGAVSAELAHEIRNPLMSIAGFARRLLKRMPGSTEADIILSEAARLEKLLSRIGDYLKQPELSRSDCSVRTALADSVGLLYPELDQKGLKCELEIDDATPTVLADPDALRQVLVMMLRCAMEGTQPDATLLVTVQSVGGAVQVQCQSPGLLDESVDSRDGESLFLPFGQDCHERGLPRCRQMVEDMGGVLNLRQDSKGTLFTLNLPMSRGGLPCPGPLGHSLGDPGPFYDANTGALTRPCLEDLLERGLRSAARDNVPMAIMILDLDHFDAYAADISQARAKICLTDIARRLNRAVRGPNHYLAHMGAQRFMAVCLDTSASQAMDVAESLRRTVAEPSLACPLPQDSPRLTASLGLLVGVPLPGALLTEMMDEAGKALHQAKRNGRNTIHVEPMRT